LARAFVGVFDDTGRPLRLGAEYRFKAMGAGGEVARRFHGEYRIGAALFHLSNAGTAGRNPGTEALVISLCIPVGQ